MSRIRKPFGEAIKKTGSHRKPLGAESKLFVSDELKAKHPGFVFRWINNEHGRVQQALESGWTPVEGEGYNSVWNPNAQTGSQVGSVISRAVGVGRTENSINAVLMKLPLELFLEDREYEHEKVRKIEAALKGGSVDALGTKESGMSTYAPETGAADGSRGLSIQRDGG